MRLISSDANYQATKLRAFLGNPELVPIPQVVPNLVVPTIAVLDVPSVVDDILVLEDDEELYMDPDEQEQIDEDGMEKDNL